MSNRTRHQQTETVTSRGHVTSCKVTLVGNACTGKTSLALRYTRGSVDRNPTTTIAVDWLHQRVTVHNRKVNLQIWDTAGQERYMAVVPSFLRASSGVLLVYDVTDVNSFTSMKMWLNMVRKEEPNAVVTLVANKVDKPHRTISTQNGEEFARDNDIYFTETSAITGHNVDSVFYNLAERIVCTWAGKDPDNQDKIQLGEDVKSKKKCTC